MLQTAAVKQEAHADEPQGSKAVQGEGPNGAAVTLTVLTGLERDPMGPEMTGLWDPSEEDTNGPARRSHEGRRARGEPHFCSSAPRSRQMGGKEAEGQHRQSRPHNPHNGPGQQVASPGAGCPQPGICHQRPWAWVRGMLSSSSQENAPSRARLLICCISITTHEAWLSDMLHHVFKHPKQSGTAASRLLHQDSCAGPPSPEQRPLPASGGMCWDRDSTDTQ